MRTLFRAAALVGTACLAGHADARWLKASTAHFVVYSNDSARDVTDFATRLERLDQTLRLFQHIPDTPDSRENRVTVYVAPSVSAVQRLAGRGSSNIYGFYVPRVTGSVAFTPRDTGNHGDSYTLTPDIVLFHEYGHHFLLGNFAEAYPSWFSEGYAEFVSTIKFNKDAVQLGGPAMHRAYGLVTGNPLKLETMLASGNVKLSDDQMEAVYGRGWLLTHYILFNADRRRQFGEYLKLLNSGTPSLDAARRSFGDLKQLDHDLDRYLSATHITVLNIAYAGLPQPQVQVEPVSDGAAALMADRMRSERGVDADGAKDVLADARPIAARFPDDPVVQGWLAEMAYDAGDDTLADAAADRALAKDPRSVQALLYKARVHLRRAAKAGQAGDWAEARSWIIKANAIDNNNAEALDLYYDSFAQAGVQPTRTAVLGLQRALQLVPQDEGLRFEVARQALIDNDRDGARDVLRPLAYDPHATADNPAARLVALLDQGRSGREALAALDARAKDGAAAAN